MSESVCQVECKEDEWASEGWSRWAAVGKQIPSLCCHLCSAGMVRVLLWVACGGRQGAEHAHLLPLQIDHSISTHSKWHKCLVPPSDCSRLNSASPQCHHAFPLEYRYRRISLTGQAHLAVAGLVCTDCSLPIGILLHQAITEQLQLTVRQEEERHWSNTEMKRRI